jgi:hypothetical protein
MILMDYSNISIAAYMFAHKNAKSAPKGNLYKDILYSDFQHAILASLLQYKQKFRSYGKIVIALEGKNNWRREHFDYYKAGRAEDREASDVDWDQLFSHAESFAKDMENHFPFIVLRVDRCEADDIIAILTRHYHKVEKIGIVSSDKDFKQLQKYPNVKQFSTFTKEFLTESDPERFAFEHVIRGDKGDGIPNIRSADNSFVDKIRQKSIRTTDIDEWYKDRTLSFLTDDDMKKRFIRNNQLINFDKIPEEVYQSVVDAFESYEMHSKGLYQYFVKNRLVNFMDSIDDFTN